MILKGYDDNDNEDRVRKHEIGKNVVVLVFFGSGANFGHFTLSSGVSTSLGVYRPHIFHFFSTQIFSAEIFLHIDLEKKRHRIRQKLHKLFKFCTES